MKRLLEYVVGMSDEDLQGLAIQDISLCQAWLSNDGPEADGEDFGETLSRRITYWLAHARPQSLQSEGRRHQTVLRELLERAEQPGVNQLARDELDFLETVHAMASAAQATEAFERVRRIIQKFRVRISAQRSKLPDVKGLPTISKRLMVVTTEDIASAPAQDVRYVAGIELPSRGPVLKHSGHLRVLGDVPENATLVVEEADVVVDGFVMGRIAASGGCEILNNVSGVVIAGRGDVRARNLVEGAYVIAKRGWIHCRAIRGAKLAFSGSDIRVGEDASRSRMLAPRIKVAGRLEGGEVHTSESATAQRLAPHDNAPLNIIFRRKLSCHDYGEQPGRSMASDLSKALRLRRKCEHTSQRMQMAALSAEQSAEAALAHIILGDSATQIAKDLSHAHRRLDVIHRVLMGMHATYGAAEEQLTQLATEDGSTNNNELQENYALIEEIGSEVDAILADLPDGDSLRQHRAELESSHVGLRAAGTNRAQIQATLRETADKLESLQRECDELRESIRQNQKQLQAAMQRVEGLGVDLDGGSRVIAVQHLVAKLRDLPTDNPMRKRLSTSQAIVQLKNVQRNLAEMKSLKGSLDDLKEQFAACQADVWDQYQTHIPDPDQDPDPPRVTGVFGDGVRLLADEIYLKEDSSHLPGAAVFTVHGTEEAVRRFVCESGKIREESMAPEENTDASVAPQRLQPHSAPA